jgi:hypothetical protein
MAQITVQGINHYLGIFTSKYDAARVYNRAARKHFGKFACLNPV